MPTIEQALARFRQDPARAAAGGPFRLHSTVAGPALPGEVDTAWMGRRVEADAALLWSICRGARLCEDVDYGQWGLVLLDPEASAKRTMLEKFRRSTEIKDDDIVIGEFLGDQELLILAPSESDQRRILIALPIYRRPDWFGAGRHLGDFLNRYFDAGGNKYWETTE